MHSAHEQINYIFEELDECAQNKFTGVLEFQADSGQQWRFYYRLGRITWATGGMHPYRRLRRQLTNHPSQIPFAKIPIKTLPSPLSHWDFQLLVNCFKKGLIEPKQLESIADSVIQELLFDVIQTANRDREKINHTRNPQISLDLPITFTSTKAFIRRTDSEWQAWYSAGLESFCPDSAPIIRQPNELQRVVSAGVYQNFAKFINGQNSLRDLSVQMKQEGVKITASLRSHILKGLIELIPIPDLSPAPTNPGTTPVSIAPPVPSSSRLIACIDDSPQICNMMERIVVSNGMRFIKISDPIQALPALIQNKPDFIFLDLIMPVVNGYEICSQIRRISSFANIPVVILTSSDGLFDRVRAKAVGSTDFMSKPIVTDKVLAMIDKYLSHQSMKTEIHSTVSVKAAV